MLQQTKLTSFCSLNYKSSHPNCHCKDKVPKLCSSERKGSEWWASGRDELTPIKVVLAPNG